MQRDTRKIKNVDAPTGGLEPPTTRLRALRSTDWARTAAVCWFHMKYVSNIKDRKENECSQPLFLCVGILHFPAELTINSINTSAEETMRYKKHIILRWATKTASFWSEYNFFFGFVRKLRHACMNNYRLLKWPRLKKTSYLNLYYLFIDLNSWSQCGQYQQKNGRRHFPYCFSYCWRQSIEETIKLNMVASTSAM